VGFITSAHLAAAPLPVTGEQPFSRCESRPGEPDPSLCHVRANTQLAACQQHCAKSGSPTDCGNGCDARLRECIETCDRPAAPPPVAAPAIPTPAAVVEPAAEAVPPAGDEAVEKAGPKRKGAKKKIVKKKKK
jgi:hypothetical protein